MTHTSGLTYGFHHAHPVDEMYRTRRLRVGPPRGIDLARPATSGPSIPLLFQPGTEWNYSMSVDVLGRLVEVISGQSLDEFLAERIFEPLGMVDTAFHVPEAEQGRLAALYVPNPMDDRRAMRAREARRRRTPADLPRRWRRPLLDHRRLPPLPRHAAARRRARRRSAPRSAHRRLHDHEPPAGRRVVWRRSAVRCSARPPSTASASACGFAVVDDPAAGKVPGSRGEFSLGWRGEHGVLGRPGRGHHRGVHDPAPAVEHLAVPLPAARPGVPGHRRLSRRASPAARCLARPTVHRAVTARR